MNQTCSPYAGAAIVQRALRKEVGTDKKKEILIGCLNKTVTQDSIKNDGQQMPTDAPLSYASEPHVRSARMGAHLL